MGDGFSEFRQSLAQKQVYRGRAIYQQTLHLKETVLGEDNTSILESINNLTISLSNQGKYTEAKAIYRQILQLKATVLRKDHSDMLARINNLAISLYSQGKYAEAEAIRSRAVGRSE